MRTKRLIGGALVAVSLAMALVVVALGYDCHPLCATTEPGTIMWWLLYCIGCPPPNGNG